MSKQFRTRDELAKATEAWFDTAHKILWIGLSPLVDIALLDAMLTPFRADHPQVASYFKVSLLDDHGDRLATGSVDVGAVLVDVIEPNWERAPFYVDPLLYLPRDGDGAARGARSTAKPCRRPR